MRSMFEPRFVKPAIWEAFKRLAPQVQWKNPVMFVCYVGAILTTGLFLQSIFGKGEAAPGYIFAVSLWLWFTVLFANFAEAMAEGRGKAQAAALRATRKDITAKKLMEPRRNSTKILVKATQLERSDIVLVEAGDTIPLDGEVIEGVASVNESAITGESAPVIREAGGDFSSVTGGTLVISDWLIVRSTARPGESFLDRMIAMVEGAKRQKTPNEIALTVLLVVMTLVFLLACATLLPYSIYAVETAKQGSVVEITTVALLVCLIPQPLAACCRRSASPAWAA
jgi:K+-transporting ATPase ATPase B chain